FVQQQQRRLGGQRTRQLQALALGERQAGGRLRGLGSQTQPLDDGARVRARPRRRRMTSERTDQHVVEHAQPRKRAHDLERARQPASADRVWRLAQQRAAAEADIARVGPQKARQQVEDRRLARAVRADQPEHLALGHREVEPGHGVHAAEVLRETARLEQRRAHLLTWGAPRWPPTPPNARSAPSESGRSSATRSLIVRTTVTWAAPRWPPTPPNARSAPSESGRSSATRSLIVRTT